PRARPPAPRRRRACRGAREAVMARKSSNISRRGNSWIVYFRRDGRQTFRSFADREYGGERPAKAAAELFLAQAMVRRAQGQPEPPTLRITLAEHAVDWLEKKRGRIGEQTYVNYSSVLVVH